MNNVFGPEDQSTCPKYYTLWQEFDLYTVRSCYVHLEYLEDIPDTAKRVICRAIDSDEHIRLYGMQRETTVSDVGY